MLEGMGVRTAVSTKATPTEVGAFVASHQG